MHYKKRDNEGSADNEWWGLPMNKRGISKILTDHNGNSKFVSIFNNLAKSLEEKVMSWYYET